MAGEIQEYTDQIVEILNLEKGVYPDENKVFSLDLGQDLIVRYNDLHPGLYMVSYLGPLSEKNRETFLIALMHMNLFGNGTGKGVIGYDDEIKLLTFSQVVPYRLQFEEFKNALEDFINYVEFWKTELNKASQGMASILTTLN